MEPHIVLLMCVEKLKIWKNPLLPIRLASHSWLLGKDNLFIEIIRTLVYEIKLCVALKAVFKNTTSSSELKVIDQCICVLLPRICPVRLTSPLAGVHWQETAGEPWRGGWDWGRGHSSMHTEAAALKTRPHSCLSLYQTSKRLRIKG